mgnify:CR=1 FL=1
MSIEIKIPSVGESVQEAVLAEWFKQDGDTVSKDEPLFVIETDKVTLEVVAEAAARYGVSDDEILRRRPFLRRQGSSTKSPVAAFL